MKYFLGLIAGFCVIIFGLEVLAQVASTSTTTTMLGQSINSAISGAVDKIPASVPTWFIIVFGGLIELLTRVVPSSKPTSLLLAAGTFFHLVGSGFQKISDLLDLLIQNTKGPPK